MKIVFHEAFYGSDYAADGAAAPGRLEAIMNVLTAEKDTEILTPASASEEDILRAHSPAYLAEVKNDSRRHAMAMLAAGAAIRAAETGMTAEPAFACLRPPGHHAASDSSWGSCVYGNMAIALLKLKAAQRISSAFILDFDAHTGDGTKALLASWRECRILNPYAESSAAYIQEILDFLRSIPAPDIIGVCAGFDSYEKDLGKKLSTFDFYEIGVHLKKYARREAGGRRFAILEGGYYQPDLGKNVLSFCQGFQ